MSEQTTGGEAFIPRLGNLARIRRIVEAMVRDWYGGADGHRRDTAKR